MGPRSKKAIRFQLIKQKAIIILIRAPWSNSLRAERPSGRTGPEWLGGRRPWRPTANPRRAPSERFATELPLRRHKARVILTYCAAPAAKHTAWRHTSRDIYVSSKLHFRTRDRAKSGTEAPTCASLRCGRRLTCLKSKNLKS